MAKAVIIPKFGFTLEETEIVQWLVSEGDTVQEGDPLLEVTTDKVNMEVDAAVDGIIAGITAQAGDIVPVTATVAWLLKPGEALPAPTAPVDQPQPAQTLPSEPATNASGPANVSPIAQRIAQEHDVDLKQIAGTGPGGRIVRADVESTLSAPVASTDKVRATPAARRIAREHQLDLSAVAGSGPNGRVQQSDVEMAINQQTGSKEPEALQVSTQLEASGITAIPFDNMRRTIARRLQSSMQQAPHIFFEAEIDVTELQRLCQRANQRRKDDQSKINLTAAITKGVAAVLKRHPRLNAHLEEDTLLQHRDVHIGIAVALENGLVVPVARNVDTKGMLQLAGEIRALAQKARDGKLAPDDMAGGTFTISNLGMYGTKRFTAIINPPQVGILAVGTVRKTVVVDSEDAMVVRPIMNLTLSVDHRAVDGAIAAQFMSDLTEVLEDPMLMHL